MSNCQLSNGDIPACVVTRQGELCRVCFSSPCEMTVLVSAEAFKELKEEDLYELCLAQTEQNLARARLEFAQWGESGAFCVRWKK